MAQLIADKYRQWEAQCEARFRQLKANEEELNRIFIEIYGLQGELDPEVKDQDITVRRAQLQREIKSLISYAVGCLFGRYSLDTEGVCYAGGAWDESKYRTVIPVRDNVLVLCDDEGAEEDLAALIFGWVETVYGKETLEENLRFIADALGGQGTARQVIRHYLLTGFYEDHVRTYRKRPIYWLVSSGKKNGFKALFYLHRYQPELLEKILSEYVPARYHRCLSRMEALQGITVSTAAEKLQHSKAIGKLTEQLAQIASFEEVLRPLAEQRIQLDLDDGVKVSYAKLQKVLQDI